jgi:hypothetical protein
MSEGNIVGMGGNADHKKLGRLTTLTSLENVTSPEMVVWSVDCV